MKLYLTKKRFLVGLVIIFLIWILQILVWQHKTITGNSLNGGFTELFSNDYLWVLNTKPYIVVEGKFQCNLQPTHFILTSQIFLTNNEIIKLYSDPIACNDKEKQMIKLYNHELPKEIFFKTINKIILNSDRNIIDYKIYWANGSP